MKKKVLARFLMISACVLLTGCHIKHEWQEATCTEPKICSVCGETEGEALGHEWQEATCTEAKTCSVCGETEGEALGHEWQEATCTEPKTCSVCGETEGEALGHEWQEATCTEAKTCSVCGETEGEALGHEWQEATCTKPKTCSICGETEGEPLGHEADDNGNCIRCGEYTKDGIAWSFEENNGYGILTIWGNGPLSGDTLAEAGFTYDLVRNIHEIVITGNINDIQGWNRASVKSVLAKEESLPLERIIIEDSVTGKIKDYAFYSSPAYIYANLSDIYIGNGIEEIERYAFYQCKGIEVVYVGDNCKKIGEMVFAGSPYLWNVSIPEGCDYVQGTAYSSFLFGIDIEIRN